MCRGIKMTKRIHLNAEEFELPISKHYSKDEDVELVIVLRNLTMARKVKKQILSDQKIVEAILQKQNKE